MTYIIAEPCIDIKDRSCVDVCPVDCIHEANRILVIDPEECIDCGACEPECPVEAIFPEDALPAVELEQPRAGEAYFDVGGEGVRFGLVESETDVDYDLDHVALFSHSPVETAGEYGSLGFAAVAPGPSGAPRVEVGGAWIELHPGEPGVPDRPLLNHLAVLVESADEHIAVANDLGIEIDDVVDAPNTYAVFQIGRAHV